jgi:hypothetical protein
MHSTILAILLCTAAAAGIRAPLFNFDTVPVYQHLASVNSTLFPPARAAWLALYHPLIVIEHVQNAGFLYTPPAGAKKWGPEPFTPPLTANYFEDNAASAAAQIHALNESVIVLYYENVNAALPWYRLTAPLATGLHPEWRGCGKLKDDAMVPYASFEFDHTQKGVLEWFVESFVNTTTRFPSLDGVYIDQDACTTSSPEQWSAVRATLIAMQAARPDLIVGFDTTNGVLAGNNGFRAAMDYSFTRPTVTGQPPPTLNSGAEAVAWLQLNGEAGVISLAHDGAELYNYSLSVFLAGVHNTTPSYYAYSSMRKGVQPMWLDCWDGGSSTAPVFPTWCAGMGASDDYSRPLGRPLGPAIATGKPRGEVVRNFLSGTNVTVELNGSACEIDWSDGHRTICI